MSNEVTKLQVLQEEWSGCVRCDLSDSRKGMDVCGVYTPEPPIDFLVVIDAPSLLDMHEGVPLSDERGIMIDEMFRVSGVDPLRVARLALVGCHPHVIIPSTETEREKLHPREPAKDELEACLPRVLEAIYHLDPRVIFAMGSLCLKTLVPKKRDREAGGVHGDPVGNQYVMTVPGKIGDVRYPVIHIPSIALVMSHPGIGRHQPIALTTEYIRQGVTYVKWLKEEEERS